MKSISGAICFGSIVVTYVIFACALDEVVHFAVRHIFH